MASPFHVTFIHGLDNKPAPDELRRIWLEALATSVDGDEGFDLAAVGGSASFVCWANLFYDKPIPAAQYESRKAELEASFSRDLPPPSDPWSRTLLEKFPSEEAVTEDPPVDETTPGYERIPIPWFIKRRIMQHFVIAAHDYLFNTNGIRDTIRDLVIADFKAVPSGTRHVLVGHSQGTFIGYDVLTGVSGCKGIDGFLTLGSPLGIDEIQDKLVWSRYDGFPAKLLGDWVNVFDPFDIVARPDPWLANDFKKNGAAIVIDVVEENWGTWRHSATKYFKGIKLRQHLRRLCDRGGA